MNLNLLFQIVNTIVLPMWVLMIIIPNHKITQKLISFPIIPILLAITYIFIVIPGLSAANPEDFTTLQGLKKLFQTNEALLAGWIHYLAFDLAVGMWLVVQNRQLGLSKWIMLPILLFTFMMGPAGFLLFHMVRLFRKTIKGRFN